MPAATASSARSPRISSTCSKESRATIKGLGYTPAGAFGSARYKLKSLEQDRAKYERLIEVFKAHDIGYFFYNGGNDSMDTANKVSQIGDQLGHRVICVGVPKTVDNDLPHTDCMPGLRLGRQVHRRCRRAKPRSTWRRWPRPRPRCSSWKSWAATPAGSSSAAGLAGKGPDEAPHIILFPEIAFDKEKFLAKVKDAVSPRRLLRGRGLRGRARRRRQVPRRRRHQGCLRSHPARRCRAGGGQHGARGARLQVPLGGARLSTARLAPHRLEGGRRSRPMPWARPRSSSR